MNSDPDGPGVPELVADLFRTEAGRLTARLARLTGSLDTAEELVQATLLKALQLWPFQGVPDNPPGWLWQAARNAALDGLRRRRFQADVTPEAIADGLPADPDDDPRFAAELADDRLRLLFACCHPLLAVDAQVALTLKTVCGLGTTEIARAFLVPQPTLAQRLVRAKATLRNAAVPFDFPAPPDLPTRLGAVRQTVYLLLNEGYEASAGEALVRPDLVAEAVRLVDLLTAHPLTGGPETHALAALVCLKAACVPARRGADGLLLTLAEQDRSCWDPVLTARGFHHFRLSMAGEEETRFHLEAAITSVHAAAPSWAQTDWPRILTLYDRLMALAPSPIIALNRAVALAEVEGPIAAVTILDLLAAEPRMRRYPLFHAVRAELTRRAGDIGAASAHLRTALALDPPPAHRRLLERRLGALNVPDRADNGGR